jgi:hypothetical protein
MSSYLGSATNDDRMNQVVYANGLLYSGVNTIIGDGGSLALPRCAGAGANPAMPPQPGCLGTFQY